MMIAHASDALAPRRIVFTYSGRLGTLPDVDPPPTWEVVRSRIAPANDSVERWNAVEKATVDWLRLTGIELVPVMRTENYKLPDAASVALRIGVDIKNGNSLDRITLRRVFSHGIQQSSRLVIARADVTQAMLIGMTLAEAESMMEFALKLCGTQLEGVLIYLNGGEYLAWGLI